VTSFLANHALHDTSLQGIGSIATTKIVAIDAVLWQYAPIATKWHSLASVAIKPMVIGYCNENAVVATRRSIATTMREVATYFPVATLTYLHILVCRDSLTQRATKSWRLLVCGDRHLWQ
jgi:hypothetical protein